MTYFLSLSGPNKTRHLHAVAQQGRKASEGEGEGRHGPRDCFITVRIPVAAADAFYKFRANLVRFNGQRVVSIGEIQIIDMF
tara:strand:+ start:77456 stop:77701 length:246 start_codon:yes stop_codon:yes gene_type:complete